MMCPFRLTHIWEAEIESEDCHMFAQWMCEKRKLSATPSICIWEEKQRCKDDWRIYESTIKLQCHVQTSSRNMYTHTNNSSWNFNLWDTVPDWFEKAGEPDFQQSIFCPKQTQQQQFFLQNPTFNEIHSGLTGTGGVYCILSVCVFSQLTDLQYCNTL